MTSDSFGTYMVGVPLLLLLIAFVLATGLWPILLIFLFWPKRG